MRLLELHTEPAPWNARRLPLRSAAVLLVCEERSARRVRRWAAAVRQRSVVLGSRSKLSTNRGAHVGIH